MTVDVPVKLRGTAGRSAAAVTLSLTPHYRSVFTALASPVRDSKVQSPAAVNAEHASAAAHVSQPELLLPTEAVNGRGKDSAETRSFSVPVVASRRRGSFAGQPMLVRPHHVYTIALWPAASAAVPPAVAP